MQYLLSLGNKPLEVESLKEASSGGLEKNNERELLKERKKTLRNLADEEKVLLRKLLSENKRSDKFSIYNSTINGLMAIGIVFQSSSHIVRDQATFIMSDWAWEMLKTDNSYLK